MYYLTVLHEKPGTFAAVGGGGTWIRTGKASYLLQSIKVQTPNNRETLQIRFLLRYGRGLRVCWSIAVRRDRGCQSGPGQENRQVKGA